MVRFLLTTIFAADDYASSLLLSLRFLTLTVGMSE